MRARMLFICYARARRFLVHRILIAALAVGGTRRGAVDRRRLAVIVDAAHQRLVSQSPIRQVGELILFVFFCKKEPCARLACWLVR